NNCDNNYRTTAVFSFSAPSTQSILGTSYAEYWSLVCCVTRTKVALFESSLSLVAPM
uniref:Uncharacterized protein n=1 Tax=Parascaris equorum TaxID=6256 RepID=A0A914RD37_PAREQ